MLIRLLAALAICTGIPGVAGAGKISHTDYHFEKPGRNLESALQRFERDLAGKRGTAEARSSKPKEIVVVGSKVKDVVRSPHASAGGFKSVSGLDFETDIVEFREGGEPASLRLLQVATRRFERTIGPASPCVRKCRATARRCLARCRRSLRQRKASGRCVCDHIRARCLVQAAKGGKCSSKAPLRRLRRR